MLNLRINTQKNLRKGFNYVEKRLRKGSIPVDR
jgi:hypothetical protein